MQVLMALSMGVIEFGQFFYIKQTFQGAARDGARAASLSTAAQSDPATAIGRTLASASVTYNSSWLTITDLTNSPATTVSDVSSVLRGHTLQITVSTNYSQLPVAMRPLYAITRVGIGNGKLISGTCTMVKE